MRQRDRVTWVVSILALVTSVFAIGGVHRLSVLAIAVLSAAAVTMLVTSQRRVVRWPPLMVLLGTAAALTAVQLIPLPIGVMRLLHPAAYELLSDGGRLAGSEPSFAPLSLDPPGTLFELVKLGAYLALSYVALRMSASERGRARILGAVAGVIGAAAGIGLINKMLEARTLYGLYRPRYAYAEFLGPLLNRNHFASLLAVGTLISGGLALRPRVPTAHRLGWAALSVFCLIESLLIQSRGAAIGLALGIGVTAGVLLLQRWMAQSDRRIQRPDLAKVTIPATIVVLCALTMVVFFSAGGVGQQIADTNSAELSEPHSKFVAWKSGARLLQDSPWVGVGRGAFESAFTHVHPGSGFLTYSHLENEYLQTAVDWGIPGALLIAAAMVWTILLAIRRWNQGPLAAAAMGALVAVAAQSMVDFGLELPGLAVPMLLVLATLTHVPVVEQSPARAQRSRVWRASGAALLVAVAVVMVTPIGRTLHEDHDLLRDTRPRVAEVGREVMRRHPVDYLAAAYVAAALYDAGDARAMDLLNQALRLHPTHPELHRLAARILLRNGRRGQALIEYQLAISADANPVALLRELVLRFPRPEDAVKALSVSHVHPRRIARILVDERRADVALPYLKDVVARTPQDVKTLKLLADIALPLKDVAASELAGRRLVELEPTQENYLGLARVYHEQKKLPEAEKAVRRALEKRGPTSVLLEANLLLADVLVEAKNWTGAREQLSKMRDQPELYVLARREIHRRLAQVEDGLGNPRQAEWERQRARAP